MVFCVLLDFTIIIRAYEVEEMKVSRNRASRLVHVHHFLAPLVGYTLDFSGLFCPLTSRSQLAKMKAVILAYAISVVTTTLRSKPVARAKVWRETAALSPRKGRFYLCDLAVVHAARRQ